MGSCCGCCCCSTEGIIIGVVVGYLCAAMILDCQAVVQILLLSFSFMCACLRLLFWPCCGDTHFEGLYDGDGVSLVSVRPTGNGDASLRTARASNMPELERKLKEAERSGQPFRDGFDRKERVSVAASTQGAATSDDLVWKRAEQFMKRSPTLFGKDGPQPLDVGQGRIGDCYFLSAIAALAEQPHRIRELFLNEEANQHGVYCVLMAQHGQWVPVWLDDCFPTMNGKPRYCNSKDTGKLWPLLLEKAYAVLFGKGAFENIEGGLPSFSFHALTMCPTLRFDTRDYSTQELWQVIKSSSEAGLAMSASCQTKPLFGLLVPPCCRLGRRKWRSILVGYGCCEGIYLLFETLLDCLSVTLRCLLGPLKCICGCPIALLLCIPCVCLRGEEGLQRLTEVLFGNAGLSGMVKGHAYSVLSAAEVETLVGTMAQIVKLRNPWGQTEWAGLYSDGSCAWTDDAEAQVGLQKTDDGAFWMLLADFISYLNVFGVCYLGPGVYSTLDKRVRGQETEKQPLCDRVWNDIDCEEDVLQRVYHGPSEWRVQSFTLSVAPRSDEAGVSIHVPVRCQAFITVDDMGTSDHSGSRKDGASWAVIVFNSREEIVGKNLVKPRILALGCVDMLTGRDRQFSDLASLSTTKMLLSPGSYIVAIRYPKPLEKGQEVVLLTHSTTDLRLTDVLPQYQPPPSKHSSRSDSEESRPLNSARDHRYHNGFESFQEDEEAEEQGWLSLGQDGHGMRFDSRSVLASVGCDE